MIRTTVASLIFVVFVSHAFGDVSISKLGSPVQQARAEKWNREHASRSQPNWNVKRPFSEIERTGYVVTNSDDAYEMDDLRRAIAQNLPDGVTFVLYVRGKWMVDGLRQRYGGALGDRLKFVTVPDYGNSVWGRDSLPFPVILNSKEGDRGVFGLVGSIYPQEFDPNDSVAGALSLPMMKTQKYFRGGNLLFDLEGNCFAEEANELTWMGDPTAFLTDYFGCATVTLLPHRGGIGDIDERLKLLEGKKAITDDDSYEQVLRSKGYEVFRVPPTGMAFETYMNTLLVNGTLFVPQMGLESDSRAVAAYEQLGFKTVPVYTKQLADQGKGNIHCVTMNYPEGAFVPSPLGRDFLEFNIH